MAMRRPYRAVPYRQVNSPKPLSTTADNQWRLRLGSLKRKQVPLDAEPQSLRVPIEG
jgi:hypothetical protein